MPCMEYFVALAFLAIIVSLGTALFFMLRKGDDAPSDTERSRRMARALTVRVALSVVLFLCLLLAWKLGYIQPTGLPLLR